ncbi:hypothetical protein TNCT_308351, partial [Trichonephila clavata]
TVKNALFIVCFVSFINGVTSTIRKRMVDYLGEYSNLPCPPNNYLTCNRGYSVRCCSNEDCIRGQVCCFYNIGCEVRCLEPMLNGAAETFQVRRDVCYSMMY